MTTAAPDDYTHTVGGVELTFAPTDNVETVNISITDDTRLESTELFYASLTLPLTDQVGLQIGDPARATITIMDDDSEHNLHSCCSYANEIMLILYTYTRTLQPSAFSVFPYHNRVIVLQFTGVMVRFERASYNVSESNSYVEVVVVKQGSSDVNVTVLLRTVDGTARGECMF